ncbi:MAG: hypothetical protein IJU54_01960, partial [Alphaproteobacteria bacterium]|nr:hypothetical protein [Alphaproteobacteria bacterium]
ALVYCFSMLEDKITKLNNAADDPGIDYLTRDSLEKQIKNCHLVYNQCLKIVCHLITYRSTN